MGQLTACQFSAMGFSLCLLVTTVVASVALSSADKTPQRPLYRTLRSFQNFRNDFSSSPGGRYIFVYHVGDSERHEERNEEGEVRGRYSFVAPEGDEYQFKYDADADGYRVESDALPSAPEDTDDVKRAKKEFFEAYQKALELAEDDDYEYSEESHEESDEEESSEESDEDLEDDSEEESQRHFQGVPNFGFRYPYSFSGK